MKKRARAARPGKLYIARVVDFDIPERKAHAERTGKPYPFKDGDHVLVLGEVADMYGHVAIVTNDGKVHYGWHTENFRRLSKDEV